MKADDMPTMTCPHCGVEEADFDGFGMLAHLKPAFASGCGWCSHPAKHQARDEVYWVCDFCELRGDR